jgi:hypothetical protein
MSLDHKLSLAQARQLALVGHGLNDGWALTQDRRGAAEVVERLGYVQIDTIAVVERAHHHTIWSRQGDYAPAMLDELLAFDRSVFEYWHHAACYLPTRDYRYSLAQMRAYGESDRGREWLVENRDLVDHVLGRIRDEGGLRSSDFEAPEGHRGGWWSRKPAKVALEDLFSRGDLMISAREGFQRRYDLRERVLPEWVDQSEPTAIEIGEHYARQNLRRMGLLQARDLTLPRLHRGDATRALAALVAAGEVVAVQVEGLEGDSHLCLADSLTRADAHHDDGAVHLLSPFDPLTIQRRWLLRLFGFDYALECYLPAAKRLHGYFSLPLLWGQRFAGRVDAKADRQAGALLLRHVELEEPYELSEAFFAALATACWRFAAFNGCDQVQVERTTPDLVTEPLRRAVEAGAHA